MIFIESKVFDDEDLLNDKEFAPVRAKMKSFKEGKSEG